jgi:hypothetical protein
MGAGLLHEYQAQTPKVTRQPVGLNGLVVVVEAGTHVLIPVISEPCPVV